MPPGSDALVAVVTLVFSWMLVAYSLMRRVTSSALNHLRIQPQFRSRGLVANINTNQSQQTPSSVSSFPTPTPIPFTPQRPPRPRSTPPMATMSNGHAQMAYEVWAANITPRRIPTVGYTIQNILISIGTLASAFASLMFTFCVLLPLSFMRAFLSRRMLTLIPPPDSLKRGKVVLIVGASRGIGLEVVKQYCPEPDTTIIAVSKDADSLRTSIIELGDTPATIQMETLDLTAGTKSITQAVEDLDKKYGPISHLYAVSGISNHLKDTMAWSMDITEQMIRVNVTGIVALSMSMYEKMKTRKYGKICVVGSVAGVYSPANMISYASTKAFINTFATSFRVLASASNVDVVTVEPGFIDTRMTQMMRGQGSSVPAYEFATAEAMATKMKQAVEKGGVGVVSWPMRQSVMMYAFRGLNPICEEIGKFAAMKSGVSGKKIT